MEKSIPDDSNGKNYPTDKNSVNVAPVNKELDDRFEVLGEDTILSILRFVSHAPLEQVHSVCRPDHVRVDKNPKTELTDSLPGVCKLFQGLSEHDALWKPAIMRQLQREPELWMEGLLKVAQNEKQLLWDTDHNDYYETPNSFLERVRHALNCISYKNLYKKVISEHIRMTLPVFYMPGPLMLGGSYRVHLFEPRYRLMIAELMKDYPLSARQGGLTAVGGRQAPVFIHANRDPFAVSSGACLVKMVRCNISPRDGTADIMLLPVAYLWLEKVWVRPNSGKLHYAQSVRMGAKATKDMHQLINRETREVLVGGVHYGGDGVDDPDTSSDEEDEDFEDDSDEETWM